jgi:ribonuclease Y
VKACAILLIRRHRVNAGANEVSDNEANDNSQYLSKKIQDEMTYPGQIKITVIRETRAISFSK